MATTTVPTDEQVNHLDAAVDRAFNERDRLFNNWTATGRDEDKQAMERQDRHAAKLLDQYNAACRAQRAEVERRRAEQTERDMARDGAGSWLDPPPAAEEETAMPSASTGGLLGHLLDGLRGYLDVLGDEPDDPGADMSSDRLDPPPAAQPHQPSAKPGGTGMSDDAYKAQLAEINQQRTEYRKIKNWRLDKSSGATTSGGTAMTSGVSYGTLKARIIGISEHTKDAQGLLQQAIQDIEGQIAEAMSANEESQALDETINALMQAKEHCEQAQQMLGLASDTASSAAAQLK